MLDYRKMFEHMVAYEDGFGHANIRAINAQLNESPMSVLKMECPVSVVRALSNSSAQPH
jgi:hypothetical protein